jgi:hypothetical protein
MSISTLVKTPYTKTSFANDQQLEDFIKCSDPATGYQQWWSID